MHPTKTEIRATNLAIAVSLSSGLSYVQLSTSALLYASLEVLRFASSKASIQQLIVNIYTGGVYRLEYRNILTTVTLVYSIPHEEDHLIWKF